MNFKSFLLPLTILLAILSANANAAFVDVTNALNVSTGQLGPLTGATNNPNKPNPLMITVSNASSIEKVLFSNNANGAGGDLPNQSPADIKTAVEQQFSVTGLVPIGDGLLNGGSGAISTALPFTFLAIHFGQHELFFKFLAGIDNFSISVDGKAAGLSNFRAYGVPVPNPVPVPAAVWLFGSALVGLIGVKRNKKV